MVSFVSGQPSQAQVQNAQSTLYPTVINDCSEYLDTCSPRRPSLPPFSIGMLIELCFYFLELLGLLSPLDSAGLGARPSSCPSDTLPDSGTYSAQS